MAIIKKGQVKLVIFTDDNGEVKNKICKIVDTDDKGIEIQYWDIKENKELDTKPFFITWSNVKKIKEVSSQ